MNRILSSHTLRQWKSRSGDASLVRSRMTDKKWPVSAKNSPSVCLQVNVKKWLYDQIFEGKFPDGALIPAERVLAERLKVSRITVRAVLADMAREGIIDRRHGGGTRVCLRRVGYKSSMDVITLVAPTSNWFFSGFMDHFCSLVESYGALVLFKAAAAVSSGAIEHYLYQLIAHDIRNMVIWPLDRTVDTEKIRRLRGLGCNIVFFDMTVETSLADVVMLDNAHAIASLCRCARKRGKKRLAYVGWNQMILSSTLERENAFIAAIPTGTIVRLPWQDRDRIDHAVGIGLKQFGLDLIDGMICADGRIGAGVGRLMRAKGHRVPVYCVDDHPQAEHLGITTYAQPITRMVETVYACLREQAKGASNWRGKNIKLKGQLIKR